MTARRLLRFPMIVLFVLAACLVQVSVAAAAGVNVRDDAVVLTASDQQTIRDSAARAPFSLYVWTVRGGYTGNKAGFVSAADALVNSNNMVIVAVDPVDKFSHVAARNARLTSAAIAAAKVSANSSFAKGQWGEGVNAAVGRLTKSVGGSRANGATALGGNGAAPGVIQSSFPWGPLIIIVLIIGAVVVGVMALLRSKQRRSMPGPQDGVGPGYAGGPGYGPGYGGGPGSGGGAGYGRGGGIGGMLAGGALGGIGGGLLGYELGRESSERQGGSNDADPDREQGGFVESDDGGGGADWGGGGDFGGGGSDF